MEHRATSYHSQGLARALQVLRALGADDSPLSLAQLAAQLDLPKSTLVRLLAVLQEEGFVRREGEPPVFGIGDSLLEIADRVLRTANAADIASPMLRRLANETGLTANIGVLSGASILHVCVEEPNRPLRFRSTSGSFDHTYCTGLGKMLLATLPSDSVAAHLPPAPFQAHTSATITTRTALESELEAIRTAGFSADDQERDVGVACISVSIPNSAGTHAALSVAGPSGELTETDRARLLPLLRSAADELGRNQRLVSALRSVRGAHPQERHS